MNFNMAKGQGALRVVWVSRDGSLRMIWAAGETYAAGEMYAAGAIYAAGAVCKVSNGVIVGSHGR